MEKSLEYHFPSCQSESTRLIPYSSSPVTYKYHEDMPAAIPPSPIPATSVDLSLRENAMLVRESFSSVSAMSDEISSNHELDLSLEQQSLQRKPVDSLRTTPHYQVVAQALGFKHKNKVLKFGSPKSPKHKCSSATSHGSSTSSASSENSSLSPYRRSSGSNVVKNLAQQSLANLQPLGVSHSTLSRKISIHSPENLASATVLVANNILQAPGLRNDYYSNLVTWSPRTNKVMVGLGENAYVWGVDNVVQEVPFEPRDTTVCTSSSDGVYSIITTANGNVFLVDQLTNQVGKRFNVSCCVYVVEWFPGGKSFLLGDEAGKVTCYDIVLGEGPHAEDQIKVVKKYVLECHRQQICGIALNGSASEVAVGANDNCCTIWNIRDKCVPRLKFVLPHFAAVKALAYCPWTSSLLATGGGTKDRTVRFWHTGSGTLLSSHHTKGQVTSLTWSVYRKEIVATYGFGDSENPLLIATYSYPQMRPIMIVPASPSLRILSACACPNHESICVATNDSTVRMYKLWQRSHELVSSTASPGSGVYGSTLIDLYEGVSSSGDMIR